MVACTTTSTVSYAITSVIVDMTAPRLDVTFTTLVNGERNGDVLFIVTGPLWQSLFEVSPNATLTRADDMATAIYNLAIGAGLISGTVQ